MQITNCILEHEDKILVLLRPDAKNQERYWDLPAGVVTSKESVAEAIVRVVFDEVGLKIDLTQAREISRHNFISAAGKPYEMVTFNVKLREPAATKSQFDLEWADPKDLLKRPNLIKNLETLLRSTDYV